MIAITSTLSPVSDPIDDTELVARFKGGDESAFVEIVNRHRTMVFSIALALLRNRADADEITQDVFIRAYRGLVNFRGDSALKTWLHTIAQNLARNRYWYWFRRRRHMTLSVDMPLSDEGGATFSDLISTEQPTPAQEAAVDEFSNFVAICMQKLNRRQREILTMRNIRNMTYEDIAACCCLEVGTVKSRIARARDELRRHLRETCPEFGYRDEELAMFLATRSDTGTLRIAR